MHRFKLSIRPLNDCSRVVPRAIFKFFVVSAELVKDSLAFFSLLPIVCGCARIFWRWKVNFDHVHHDYFSHFSSP